MIGTNRHKKSRIPGEARSPLPKVDERVVRAVLGVVYLYLKAHHLGRDWGERELYEALRVEARNLANEFGRVFPDSVPRAIASFVAAGGEEASL